jgi:hypothetical protein
MKKQAYNNIIRALSTLVPDMGLVDGNCLNRSIRYNSVIGSLLVDALVCDS